MERGGVGVPRDRAVGARCTRTSACVVACTPSPKRAVPGAEVTTGTSNVTRFLSPGEEGEATRMPLTRSRCGVADRDATVDPRCSEEAGIQGGFGDKPGRLHLAVLVEHPGRADAHVRYGHRTLQESARDDHQVAGHCGVRAVDAETVVCCTRDEDLSRCVSRAWGADYRLRRLRPKRGCRPRRGWLACALYSPLPEEALEVRGAGDQVDRLLPAEHAVPLARDLAVTVQVLLEQRARGAASCGDDALDRILGGLTEPSYQPIVAAGVPLLRRAGLAVPPVR